jgi:hypothetical protein
MRQIVIIESPYAGDVDLHLRYARAAMRDSIFRNEAPFASHALYTQPGVLRDDMSEERALGMLLADSFRKHAVRVAVYTDLGISKGMQHGIEAANEARIPVVYRNLEGWPNEERAS